MVQRRPSSHHGVGHTIKAINPMRHANRSDMRDYATLRNPGGTPSQEFDWDAQLVRHARTMKELGYPLSAEQKRRLES